MRENADQNNSEYGHFLCSARRSKNFEKNPAITNWVKKDKKAE